MKVSRRFPFLFGILYLAATACAFGANGTKLVVGATPVPGGEILEFVKPLLAAKGVELEVKIFTDYLQPNAQLAAGRLDANLYQHRPFLADYTARTGADLVALVPVLIAPLGAYSTRWKHTAELPQGATIALPNDPTNEARALQLLEHQGFIKLKPGIGTRATPRDITENPRSFRFRELEAATLPRILAQVDLAVINTNYALEAKLDPLKDALVREGPDSPYVNVLVTRTVNREDPNIKALSAVLQSEDVRKFIETRFHGSILPAF